MIKVSNGVIQGIDIGGVPFSAKIVQPRGTRNVRTLIPMTEILGPTVHNTANAHPDAGDEMHARYLQNVENADNAYVSWHFTVDFDSITQHIPITEVAWHAGDGNGPGNYKTIGVEIAENVDYAKAERNAIILLAHLNIYLKSIGQGHKTYKHQDWSGKYCPRLILSGNRWPDFVNRIDRAIAEIENPTPAPAQQADGVLFRVQTGAFKSFDNAIALDAKLKAAGFATYVIYFDGFYKVQVGAYAKYSNAVAQEKRLKAAGYDTYLTTKSGVKAVAPKPAPKPTIKVGSRVRVKNGARDWSGVSLSPKVYANTYTVIEMSGDRVVIGIGRAVTAAVHKSNLILA